MKLDDAPESSNVEDRRGQTATMAAAGGGGILLVILGLIFGVDVNKLKGPGAAPKGGSVAAPADGYKQFAGKVLGTLEEVWEGEFSKAQNNYGRGYEKPKLVIFSDAVDSGCGRAPSAVGPFYCPADKTMYLDPTFFTTLANQLGGSKAEFSQAYVIAHENGHHVQNLLGYNRRVGRDDNEGSVRLELMADYLAGVWAFHANKKFNILQAGDLEEAIRTANKIGDDAIAEASGRFPSPEGFNHGTSRQRAAAFTAGAKTGDASKARLDRFFTVPYSSRRGEVTEDPWK